MATAENALTDSKRFHKALLRWYHLQGRVLPWRALWQKHRDPWHIWVSEVMLQQTVIKAVIPVYERFLNIYPTPSDLAAADSESVRLAVRGLGYYRRFDFLHRATKFLQTERHGVWPSSYDEWLTLPGIGDYTASAISSITNNEPHGVVDGNVERVMCRLLDIRTAPNLPVLKAKFKIIMNDLVAHGSPGDINQAVMELGQTVCTTATPRCDDCPVSINCASFAAKSQHLAPAAKERAAFKDVALMLVLGSYKGKYAMTRRPETAKFLKATLGFPTLIADRKHQWSGEGFEAPGWVKQAITAPVTSIVKHNITSHRIHARVVLVTLDRAPANAELLAAKDVESRLVSNLDRKAWIALDILKKI